MNHGDFINILNPFEVRGSELKGSVVKGSKVRGSPPKGSDLYFDVSSRISDWGMQN